MEKININNKQEISQEDIVEDPLVIIWGIYNTEIAPTGATDSEFSMFKDIEELYKSGKITGEETIKKAHEISQSRNEYH